MKTIKLIAKNFKTLMRAKSAALIILLGPLLIMVIAGIAFNNADPFDLNLGIYAPEQTETSVLFTTALSEQYRVMRFEDATECRRAVQGGQQHACIVYPESFMIEQGRVNDVEIYVDTSRANVVDVVEQSLAEIISQQRGKISSDLTQTLVDTIDNTATDLTEYRAVHIARLRGQAANLSSAITAIGDQARTLNLSYDPDEMTLEAVDVIVTNIDLQASEVREGAEDIATELHNFADDILDMNISGRANAAAEDAKESAEDIEDVLTSDTDQISELQDDLMHVLRRAQDNLAAVRSQLDSAQSTNTEVLRGLDTQRQQATLLSGTVDDLDAALNGSIAQLRGVEITDIASIVHRITITPRTVVGNVSKLNYLFPSLMMLVIMFVSIMLACTLIIMEKLSPARFRIFMTPIKDTGFILSTLLTVLIIVLLQIVVISLVAQYGFNIDVIPNFLNVFLVLLCAALIFIFLGMCVGYLFITEHTAILGGISISSLFLLISDLILPLESMPHAMQAVIAKTPFVLGTNVLRQTVIFGADLPAIMPGFFYLVLYAVALFILIIVVQKIAKVFFILNHARKNK
jgi:ABC-2 type transport system permease protein